MEQNNLETQFKEKLNSREITPTEMAWDRLNAMLSVTEKPKTKSPWLYIAASFVGFVLIATFYFSQKTSTIKVEKNEVVIQNKIKPQNNENSLNIDENNVENKVVAVVSEKLINTYTKPELKKAPVIAKDSSHKNQAIVSINNQFKENDVIVNSSEKKNYESLNENKYVSAEKLLAEVSNTKFEPKAIDKINKKNRKGISVNPNRLLSDAETELNQSYRESALDRVNKNFKAIKTVLVNRNYEQ